MTIDWEGVSCNEEAARLLPWYVAGRLSPADVERVADHLQRCAICRNDVAQETEVRAALKADARIEYAPQAGLAKTLSRIDELGREAPASIAAAPIAAAAFVPSPIPARARQRRIGALQWLTAAVLVQAVALGWLGVSLRHPSPLGVPGSRYETLSAESQYAAGPHIRAVFAPTMTLAELKSLLTANHLVVVRGPTEAGAYTLALASSELPVSTSRLNPTVAALRSDARVLFAEPAVNDAASLP